MEEEKGSRKEKEGRRNELSTLFRCYRQLKASLKRCREAEAGGGRAATDSLREVQSAFYRLLDLSRGCLNVRCLTSNLIPLYVHICSPSAIQSASRSLLDTLQGCQQQLKALPSSHRDAPLLLLTARSSVCALTSLCLAASAASLSSRSAPSSCSAVIREVAFLLLHLAHGRCLSPLPSAAPLAAEQSQETVGDSKEAHLLMVELREGQGEATGEGTVESMAVRAVQHLLLHQPDVLIESSLEALRNGDAQHGPHALSFMLQVLSPSRSPQPPASTDEGVEKEGVESDACMRDGSDAGRGTEQAAKETVGGRSGETAAGERAEEKGSGEEEGGGGVVEEERGEKSGADEERQAERWGGGDSKGKEGRGKKRRREVEGDGMNTNNKKAAEKSLKENMQLSLAFQALSRLPVFPRWLPPAIHLFKRGAPLDVLPRLLPSLQELQAALQAAAEEREACEKREERAKKEESELPGSEEWLEKKVRDAIEEEKAQYGLAMEAAVAVPPSAAADDGSEEKTRADVAREMSEACLATQRVRVHGLQSGMDEAAVAGLVGKYGAVRRVEFAGGAEAVVEMVTVKDAVRAIEGLMGVEKGKEVQVKFEGREQAGMEGNREEHVRGSGTDEAEREAGDGKAAVHVWVGGLPSQNAKEKVLDGLRLAGVAAPVSISSPLATHSILLEFPSPLEASCALSHLRSRLLPHASVPAPHSLDSSTPPIPSPAPSFPPPPSLLTEGRHLRVASIGSALSEPDLLSACRRAGEVVAWRWLGADSGALVDYGSGQEAARARAGLLAASVGDTKLQVEFNDAASPAATVGTPSKLPRASPSSAAGFRSPLASFSLRSPSPFTPHVQLGQPSPGSPLPSPSNATEQPRSSNGSVGLRREEAAEKAAVTGLSSGSQRASAATNTLWMGISEHGSACALRAALLTEAELRSIFTAAAAGAGSVTRVRNTRTAKGPCRFIEFENSEAAAAALQNVKTVGKFDSSVQIEFSHSMLSLQQHLSSPPFRYEASRARPSNLVSLRGRGQGAGGGSSSISSSSNGRSARGETWTAGRGREGSYVDEGAQRQSEGGAFTVGRSLIVEDGVEGVVAAEQEALSDGREAGLPSLNADKRVLTAGGSQERRVASAVGEAGRVEGVHNRLPHQNAPRVAESAAAAGGTSSSPLLPSANAATPLKTSLSGSHSHGNVISSSSPLPFPSLSPISPYTSSRASIIMNGPGDRGPTSNNMPSFNSNSKQPAPYDWHHQGSKGPLLAASHAFSPPLARPPLLSQSAPHPSHQPPIATHGPASLLPSPLVLMLPPDAVGCPVATGAAATSDKGDDMDMSTDNDVPLPPLHPPPPSYHPTDSYPPPPPPSEPPPPPPPPSSPPPPLPSQNSPPPPPPPSSPPVSSSSPHATPAKVIQPAEPSTARANSATAAVASTGTGTGAGGSVEGRSQQKGHGHDVTEVKQEKVPRPISTKSTVANRFVLCKSGVQFCEIDASLEESRLCRYQGSRHEPFGWPNRLDVTKRADYHAVNKTFSMAPPTKREVCAFHAAPGTSNASGLLQFISYLKERDRAGVIKLQQSSIFWPRLMYIIPYSEDMARKLGIRQSSTLVDTLLALVLPSMSASFP